MIAYADATACLRATILRYFGEAEAARRCGFCGNCARRTPLGDEELLVLRKVLSGVARGGERWGKRKVAAMLTGRLEDLPESLAGLSTTGILSAESAKTVERWIDAATGAELLRASEDVYRTLVPDPSRPRRDGGPQRRTSSSRFPRRRARGRPGSAAGKPQRCRGGTGRRAAPRAPPLLAARRGVAARRARVRRVPRPDALGDRGAPPGDARRSSRRSPESVPASSPRTPARFSLSSGLPS